MFGAMDRVMRMSGGGLLSTLGTGCTLGLGCICGVSSVSVCLALNLFEMRCMSLMSCDASICLMPLMDCAHSGDSTNANDAYCPHQHPSSPPHQLATQGHIPERRHNSTRPSSQHKSSKSQRIAHIQTNHSTFHSKTQSNRE